MGLSKTIFYTIISQISVQVLGVLSGVFIARLIGPEGKGVFAIYQANAMLLATFFSLSIGSVLTYFIPSGIIKPNKMLGISLLIVLFGSISIYSCILVFNYSSLKDFLFPTKYSSFLYICWIFFYSVLQIINTIATGFFQGLKEFGIINKISIINSVINVLFFATVFVLNKYNYYEINVLDLLFGLLYLTLLNTLQYIVPFITKIKIKPSFKISITKDLKPLFNFTIYTHLGIFVGFFNSRLSLWILNFYLNEIAIGLYSLASNLIVIFSLISAPIGNVLMPFLSSEEGKNKKQIFYKYSKLNFSIILIGSILGFFLSVPLIPYMYGDNFASATLLFQILIPGILFASISRLLSVYISASNKQLYNLYAAIIGFIVNIVLNYIFIKYLGLIGASIAGSITYISICMAMMYYVHCRLNLDFGNYFLMSLPEIKTYLDLFIEKLKKVREK